MAPGISFYRAVPSSLKSSDSSASLDVVNTKNQVKFLLEIIALKDNTFRVRMVEAEPLRVRYEPPIGDVLIAEPEREG